MLRFHLQLLLPLFGTVLEFVNGAWLPDLTVELLGRNGWAQGSNRFPVL